MLKLTKAAKIAANKPYSFSLPAGKTCPGATSICASSCYAKKGRCDLPDTKNAWKHNLIQLNRTKFKALDTIPETPFFRIHVGGDFYSQAYINTWTKLIASRPNTKFWAYTRSFKLDFSRLEALPNMQLFLSIDDENKAEGLALLKTLPHTRIAYGPFNHHAKIPAGAVVCPATNGQIKVSAACMRCGFCWRKLSNKPVVFLEH